MSGCGACFVSTARVVHANEAARAIVNTTPGMTLREGRLQVPGHVKKGIEGCTLETRAQILSRNYVETLEPFPTMLDHLMAQICSSARHGTQRDAGHRARDVTQPMGQSASPWIGN